MACGTCPDSVTFTLRNKVDLALQQVLAISGLADVFNRALQDVAGLAVSDVGALVDAIPVIGIPDFSEILGFLTCPLTPFALLLGDLTEFTELDPNVQLGRLKSLSKATIDKARLDYEDGIKGSDYRQVINLARSYSNQITRIRFDAVSFAEAVLITAIVLAVCGEDEYTEGPYQDFANAISGFSLTGGVPASLDVNVASLLQSLVLGETKFQLSQLALT